MIFATSARPALRAFACTAMAMLWPLLLAAQRSRRNEDDIAGCIACGMFLGFPLLGLLILILDILLMVWVAKDSKARGMDNSVLWMLFVLFFSLIGLIIYVLVRPKGSKVRCPNCGNQRLQASMKCPHCHSA